MKSQKAFDSLENLSRYKTLVYKKFYNKQNHDKGTKVAKRWYG